MNRDDEHLKTFLLDDPETPEAERRAIGLHLDECGDCRRSLESYRRARRLLVPSGDEVRPVPPYEDFLQRIYARVDSKSGRGDPSPRHAPSWIWTGAVIVLVAAVLSVVTFLDRGLKPSIQDLLASGDGDFYEWASDSGVASDDDVLKVVLEEL